MIFNTHSNLEGQHAFLGASKYHWLNYNEDLLKLRFLQQNATLVGSALHNLAHECIENKIKLSKSMDRHMVMLELAKYGLLNSAINVDDILATLVPFVNDAIGFRMNSEQVLYYSENCFGTADAISFNFNTLRIHDYKSGTIKAHMEQLMIYAALFCLEYNIKPETIDKIELRIYQSSEVLFHNPAPEEISAIMDKIIESDKIIETIKSKGV